MRTLLMLPLLSVGCLPFVVDERDQSYPVGDETTLDVLLEAGNATITGVDGSETLDLHTIVRCTSPNADPEVRLGFDESPMALRIGNDNSQCWVDVFLEVPSHLHLTVTDDSGNLHIEGVASLQVDDDSGNLDVADIDGPVVIYDDSGNLEVSGVQGDVEIQDASGNITVRDIDGDVEIVDESGNITVFDVSGVVTITDDSGNITAFDVGDLQILEDGSGNVSAD